MFGYALLFTITASLQLVAAQQTSLIMPGFEPQPFSVDVLGVDSQLGRTTWAVHNGPTDSTFLPEDQFPGVATIVEGSDYVSVNYIYTDDIISGASPTLETLAVECTLTASTVGDCSGSVFGTPVTRSQTTFTPFPVFVGTPAPAASASASPIPASSASVASSTSTTSTTASATSTKKNSATPLGGSIGFASVIGVNVYLLMSVIGNLL
ncbi:hypothetical protein D9756_006145 [Leucocoprinus leucothites]|uniref:Uncharacterized protein n=1 Tax=Leucocoprinus leucothites TaxID=201217 RepID=A0A8H5FXR0_9AGAR|nr:hypothetical protein D9756_006145 [Leucoagaricus leucothites]